jgi:hypothetical protein
MNTTRYLLAALLSFIAFNAFGGGIYGMAGAEGFPMEWLAGSPFSTYFVPSLVLFVVVGGGCLGAAIATYAEARHANVIATSAAVVVSAWIGAQVAIIGVVSWLQPVTLLAAVAVALLAWRLPLSRASIAEERPARAHRAGSPLDGSPMRVLVTWGSSGSSPTRSAATGSRSSRYRPLQSRTCGTSMPSSSVARST